MKTKVFMSGRSQAVRIPAPFRFSAREVTVSRDAQTGDLVLSQSPATWSEVFSALDQAGFPQDFLSQRRQETAETRETL
jgi:antitoxin VapB